jgi:hypothetical protein
MLQGTLDGATPYQGAQDAQDAHKLLPSARMSPSRAPPQAAETRRRTLSCRLTISAETTSSDVCFTP